MRLQQIAERVQEVTQHHYVSKLGDMYKVAQHNYNSVELTDEVVVRKVTRMWRQNERVLCTTDPQDRTIKLSDGYTVMTPNEAYEIYQLQRGAMKSLAGDATESPNYIRQLYNIDA